MAGSTYISRDELEQLSRLLAALDLETIDKLDLEIDIHDDLGHTLGHVRKHETVGYVFYPNREL